MIGKFRLTDLLSEVCGCLRIPGLAKDASEVLKTFGPGMEDELVNFYFITSGNTKLSRTILQLLGKTCTTKTMEFLFSRLLSNSSQIKDIAVKCLIDCKFNPSEEERQRLNQLISEVIGSITWYLSAKISLERDNDKFLLEKISREINRWNKFLFNILSITYNAGSISRIWENIENETIESVIYALGMADVVVSDSIKPQLVSLLDVVPDEDKIMNLFQFYPGEIPGHKKLLEDIINRDYNLISLWTKACTLRSITSIECDNMAESVTALLFSPEELIQEESANLIARSKPELYKSASQRMPESIKTRLDKIISGSTDKKELLFEKVDFLSGYFVENSEDELLSLACEMKYIKDLDGESLSSSENFIIWTLNGDNRVNEVHVVYQGESDNLIQKYQGKQDLSFYFLPLSVVEEFHFQFPDKSFEILKYIDNNEE
jgi:ATP:ADP antiporter, AAA family